MKLIALFAAMVTFVVSTVAVQAQVRVLDTRAGQVRVDILAGGPRTSLGPRVPAERPHAGHRETWAVADR